MKMAYERPMMRAEMFRANQYVAACAETFTGFVRAWDHISDMWRYFFGDESVKMVNPNDGSPQWYYKRVNVTYDEATKKVTDWSLFTPTTDDPMYYLEHSVHQGGASVLYKEAGSASGYSTDYDRAVEVDGSNSLQVNNGDRYYVGEYPGDGKHNFEKDAGYIGGSAPYYEYNTTTGDPYVYDGEFKTLYANGRYADHCLGEVEAFETLTDYKIISS